MTTAASTDPLSGIKFNLIQILLVSILIGKFSAMAWAQTPPLSGEEKNGERPELHCGTLPDDFLLDGILNEHAWIGADSIEGLVMVEPEEGAEPTGRTIVKVLCSTKHILIGAICQDPEPSGIVSFSVARDSSLRSEDHLKIVLDTFGDGRSGYVFSVNPSGARYDALVADRGEDENKNWDGLWEAGSARDENGWSVEILIPISTLSFKRGLHEWLFNVERRIQRNLEKDRWASPKQDYRITQTRQAGLLTHLPDFDLGLGLSVRPALVSGYACPSRDKAGEWDNDVSLDVTQKLGPNLLASLTYNTDFAETEVDSFRTNLTRFPLFLPEKRSFFLEGSEIFDFGLGIGRDAIPFYSRRIGLVDGQEVPLRFGGKVHGQLGGTNLGALLVNMGEESNVSPETNMGVFRIKQNVLEESSVGLIGTVGDPLGRRDSWTLGADFTYQTSELMGDKNFLTGVWGLTMDREDLSGGSRSAVVAMIDYPNDLWDMMLLYKRIGEDFDPSIGFVPRPGINSYKLGVDYMPRPDWELVRQRFYEFSTSFITDLDGRWASYLPTGSPPRPARASPCGPLWPMSPLPANPMSSSSPAWQPIRSALRKTRN